MNEPIEADGRQVHRIEKLSVHIVDIPATAVHSHGTGDVSRIRSVILKLETDLGCTGWGEASPWPVFTGTAEANAAALHIHLRPHLIGQDPRRITRIMGIADKVVVGCLEAKAALETALFDIVGKLSGLSVSDLLGGKCRERIPLSFSVANPNFDEDLRDIERLHADGIRIFKIKTGFASHAFDLKRLEQLRDIYGDGIGLRIDYNQGLPAFDAIRRLRDLEAFEPDFIEQPVKRHEWSALADITRRIDTPIMADESVFSVRDAVAAAKIRLADIFALKIMKSGGMRQAMDIASVAGTAGIEVYGGCMFETGLAHVAGAHLLASVPELRLGCEFYMANYYLTEDILTKPFPVEDGQVRVPDGPGLGVDVDTEVLSRYRGELLE
ncbi:MAG: cycloisomerase [Albidovulum sp.]|nr:cycloisomerase [Albidovulum sp.]